MLCALRLLACATWPHRVPDHPEKHLQATLEHDQRVSDNHRLIKELSIRYDQQQRRWSNYSKLLGFFAFTLLFLSVLWLQRDAQTGFAVYSTVEENVVGIFEHDTVTSAAEILPWLRRIADEQWKDPACGDGKCQAPFEFPSYSRFGCRADCSHLEAVESDSTALQVKHGGCELWLAWV